MKNNIKTPKFTVRKVTGLPVKKLKDTNKTYRQRHCEVARFYACVALLIVVVCAWMYAVNLADKKRNAYWDEQARVCKAQHGVLGENGNCVTY